MATMQFRILHEEFKEIVGALQRQYVIGEIQGTNEGLETNEEKVEGIVAFLQDFMIDMENEKKRILTQIEQLKKDKNNLAQRLSNENFLQKAPPEVVEQEKLRLVNQENKAKELETLIRHLE